MRRAFRTSLGRNRRQMLTRAGPGTCPPPASLAHGRNHERILAGRRAVGPALGDLLVLGPEADALGPMLVDVAEARALPAAERMIGDRDRDRHVDPDHAGIGQLR